MIAVAMTLIISATLCFIATSANIHITHNVIHKTVAENVIKTEDGQQISPEALEKMINDHRPPSMDEAIQKLNQTIYEIGGEPHGTDAS